MHFVEPLVIPRGNSIFHINTRTPLFLYLLIFPPPPRFIERTRIESRPDHYPSSIPLRSIGRNGRSKFNLASLATTHNSLLRFVPSFSIFSSHLIRSKQRIYIYIFRLNDSIVSYRGSRHQISTLQSRRISQPNLLAL